MDLRSGIPYSLVKNGPLHGYPILDHDEQCDVVVIGGGVTGAITAYLLVREGFDTVLLEKRTIGTGSTAASTALLLYAIDTELHRLIDMAGPRTAVRSYRLGLEAISEIEDLVSTLDDRCEFDRRTSLYLASSEGDAARVKREYETRLRAGFEVEFWDPKHLAAVSSIEAPAALVSRDDAQIEPYRFAHALIAASDTRGLRAYDHTEVESVESDGRGVTVRTERGMTVNARRIVYATGYESERFLRRKVGILESTFAVVSEPLRSFDGWPENALIWETARPYCYLRTTDDGRAMIGGGDLPYAETHADERLLERKAEELRKRFRRILPSIDFRTEYAWAGTFGSTEDGLPYIGSVAERPGELFALGYGGNGITFGAIAARIISDEIRGVTNPDAEIFSFARDSRSG